MVRELNRAPGGQLEPVPEVASSDSDRSTGSRSGPLPSGMPSPPDRGIPLVRVAFLAAAAYAFAAGLRLYEAAGIWSPAIVLGLLLYTGALVSLLATFWIRNPTGTGGQVFLASLVLVALVASVAYEISVANQSYGTDSMAITHVAGELLLQGENPYSVVGESLGPIIDRFGIPEIFVTQTTSGDSIDRLVPYPGGQVLAYTAALALGVDDLRWATLAFEIAALAVIWWALSPQARLLVPLVLLVEPNLTVFFTSGAVTDWLWVLPLVATAILLHREQWGYAGLALGIACAIKQQPWFAVPFVIVWAYMQIRKTGLGASIRRDLAALTVGVLTGFAVLNLPFLIWSPGDWLRGVLSPMLDNLVPDGQGLSLLASRGFLALPQAAFSIAMIVAFLVVLLVYYRRFDQMSNLLWVLPPALLLLSHRSLHNYFIFWIPVAALWLDLETGTPRHPTAGATEIRRGELHWKHRKTVLLSAAAVVVVASGALGIYLASGNYIDVASVQAEIDGGMVTALDVEVINTGGGIVQPVFGVYWGKYPVPWEPATPTEIGPGESEYVRIVPTSRGVIPPLVLNENGTMQPKPFRVRVNDMGHSTYTSSSLVRLDPVGESVINPEFRFWGATDQRIDHSPFGWTSTKLVPSGTAVQTRTLGGGRGVSMTVSPIDARIGGWGEAAMVQQVAVVASCYRLDISYNHEYRANAEGRPLAATGLQVIQGDSAVWFVLSDVEEIRLTDLPEGTRIVEIPANTGVREDLAFDLAAVGSGSGIEPGQRGTIKLFSGLSETQSGPQELRVVSISDCAGQPSGDL